MQQRLQRERKMTIFGMIKAADGSIWADIGEEAIASCELCDTSPAFRWECLSGRWKGARIVACSKYHALRIVDEFIRGGKISK